MTSKLYIKATVNNVVLSLNILKCLEKPSKYLLNITEYTSLHNTSRKTTLRSCARISECQNCAGPVLRCKGKASHVPSGCWFLRLLHFPSGSLLAAWESNRRWPKQLAPCHPCGTSQGEGKLLPPTFGPPGTAQACAAGPLENEPANARFTLSLFLCNSNFQINKEIFIKNLHTKRKLK